MWGFRLWGVGCGDFIGPCSRTFSQMQGSTCGSSPQTEVAAELEGQLLSNQPISLRPHKLAWPHVLAGLIETRLNRTLCFFSMTLCALLIVGCGWAAPVHWVDLCWTPSVSSLVIGYNLYRGSQSGGPYVLITPRPVTGTCYTDYTVQSGQTYYYLATAVNTSWIESVYSNEVQVTIP